MFRWETPIDNMTEKRAHFFFKGIKVSEIDLAGLQHLIAEILSANGSDYFCLTDVGNLMMAQNDLQLAKAINQAAASIADGMPLAWFGKLIDHKKVQRISGVTLFQHLLQHSSYKHFLLGDTVEMHKNVIGRARKIRPDLQIAGYSPPFKVKFTDKDNEVILSKIREKQADIIWVSFGGGKQEKWMLQNAANLHRGIMIGIGAAFKFYTGELKVPPKLIQQLGLQWLSRATKNPQRWMTKGPFKYRLLFFLNFPFEFVKAKYRRSGFKTFNRV
jgi:N-acetylglucosaminyldiphosphoundecaprenol N-acetyl-beta-D-mannosaminyltransferase